MVRDGVTKTCRNSWSGAGGPLPGGYTGGDLPEILLWVVAQKYRFWVFPSPEWGGLCNFGLSQHRCVCTVGDPWGFLSSQWGFGTWKSMRERARLQRCYLIGLLLIYRSSSSQVSMTTESKFHPLFMCASILESVFFRHTCQATFRRTTTDHGPFHFPMRFTLEKVRSVQHCRDIRTSQNIFAIQIPTDLIYQSLGDCRRTYFRWVSYVICTNDWTIRASEHAREVWSRLIITLISSNVTLL